MDKQGKPVLPAIIEQVKLNGEGFFSYPWQRNGQELLTEKLSFVRYLPQWNIFIGTGVFVDDIEREVTLRRAQALNELRQTIKNIVIAKTGYLFVFDKQGNMLIHPNDNINQTNALSLKDPVTDQSILQELMDVADSGNELVYKWDRPDDPNNYSYDKLSLVRHLKGLGWYICSSVYVDELQYSGKLLSQRILTIGLIALFFAIVLAFIFSKWITRPISALANVAKQVSKGDLTLTSGIDRKDELGVLGDAFDNMVSQLRENIQDLDSKVDARTRALNETNQQLNEVQHMNAVGQLAGGLAHDFNNILTIILGNLVAAQEQFFDEPRLLKRLAPAIRASRRGSDITNRLLAFSRRQSLVPSQVKLNYLVQETVELLQSSLPSTVNLTYTISQHNLVIYVDGSQLENCLINLVLNAKDALPDGGDITIIIREIMVTEPLNFDKSVPLGNYVQFEVLDNGSGFSADAISTAFEPFFTTKPTGEGSGLGLSMVFGFIKQSQGFIKLENRVDGGASVVFLLPLLESTELLTSDYAEPTASVDNDFCDKLILLVEDNSDVRAVVREQLVSFGFNVLEAVDSDEAQQLITTVKGLYGMVSDISMPGQINGFELADYLKQQRPNSKIVLMSGYAYDEHKESENLEPTTILRKPFVAQQLRQALEKS
jgi:signal transduction histidine kinase